MQAHAKVSQKVSQIEVTMLTDRAVKAAKVEPGKSSKYISGGNGLYLRVLASGAKSWVYRLKDADGKTRWLDIGPYPSVSLFQANSEANLIKQKRRQGIDVFAELTEQKQQEAQEKARQSARLTVRQLFEKWLDIELSQRKDGGSEIVRSFNKDVLPVIGDIYAAEVTRMAIARVLDDVVQRGARRMANRLLTDLRQMFGFGYVRGIVDNDPTHRIRKTDIGGKETERDRVLSEEELADLCTKLQHAKLSKQAECAIWIALSTCCRIGELLKAKWQDVDLGKLEWRIPSDNSKNGKAHTIYLSAFAAKQFSMLRELTAQNPSEWLYPDRTGTNHVCIKTITKQLGDRQRESPQNRMQHRAKSTDALLLAGGKWTPHDLRRTGATLMASLGIRPDVIERCLNHTEENKVKRVYQRYDYKDEQKEAWHQLGDKICSIQTSMAFG